MQTRYLIKIVLLLDTLVLLLCTSCFSPPVPEIMEIPEIVITCTCLDCSDTLSINLAGIIPSDYTLTATALDGTSVQVHCIDGYTQLSDEKRRVNDPFCFSRGAGFFNFAPDIVKVTLKWDNNEISQLL
jgi:hypothetical protein